jgi:hypothetical protein
MNHSHTCFTVWGYNNPNNYSVQVTGNHNYYIATPIASSVGTIFSPGLVEEAFLTFWNCHEHIHVHHSWYLQTNLTIGDHIFARRPKVHRLVNNCPPDVLSLSIEGEIQGR